MGGGITMRTQKKAVAGVKRMFKHPNYVLKIKVEGPGVHRKSIPIPELVKICSAIQTAVHRQAESMEKPAAKTLRRGPITASAQDECTLELVGIVPGSTGLLFRYAKPQQHLPIPEAANFGSDVLVRIAETVKDFGGKNPPRDEVDAGVLASLRELGEALERKTITRISLDVPQRTGRSRRIRAVFTPAVNARILERIKAPTHERMTIEGKLEMADFKDTGRLCRIHPSIGLPVQCSFDLDVEDQVYSALRKPARVTGTARLDPHSGRVEELRIEEIEIVDELLLGARDFFAGRTLEQLAEAQGVHPLDKPSDLAGGWPADENIDEFLETTYLSRS
jgi:hypothetical protein